MCQTEVYNALCMKLPFLRRNAAQEVRTEQVAEKQKRRFFFRRKREIPQITSDIEQVVATPEPKVEGSETKTVFSSNADLQPPDPLETYAEATENFLSETATEAGDIAEKTADALVVSTDAVTKQGRNIFERIGGWVTRTREGWKKFNERMDKQEEEREVEQKTLDEKLPTMNWWQRMMTHPELSLPSFKETLQRASIQFVLLPSVVFGSLIWFVSSLVSAPLATLAGVGWAVVGTAFAVGLFDTLYVASKAPKDVEFPILSRLARWVSRLERDKKPKEEN